MPYKFYGKLMKWTFVVLKVKIYSISFIAVPGTTLLHFSSSADLNMGPEEKPLYIFTGCYGLHRIEASST